MKNKGFIMALLAVFGVSLAVQAVAAPTSPRHSQIAEESDTYSGVKKIAARVNLAHTSVRGQADKARNQNTRVLKTGARDSVMIIEGHVDMGDVNYTSLIPAFQSAGKLFADAPRGCAISTSFFPQQAKWDNEYKYYYVFKNTGRSGKCWNYFQNQKRVKVDFTKVHVKQNGSNSKSRLLDLRYARTRTLPVNKFLTKNPSGD